MKLNKGIIFASILFGVISFSNATDGIYGDINGDGKVNKTDATLLFNYSMLPEKYASKVKTDVKVYGDVDSNGVIDIRDSQIIQSYASKKIDMLPHEHTGEDCICGAVNFLYGDINRDGKVNKTDATLLLNYSKFPEQYVDKIIEDVNIYGDVDSNGVIDIRDSNIIKSYASKKIKKLPHEHEMINWKCKCGEREPIYGDINGDGKVNKTDATLLFNYSMLPEKYASKVKTDVKVYGDVDSNGVIDIRDSQIIQSYASKKIDMLPHEHTGEDCICGAVNFLYGDINRDGKVNKTDATLLLNYSKFPEQYVDKIIEDVNIYGDVDSNGVIDIRDSNIIKSYASKKIKKLPHEHEMINGKCKCGEREPIYGDINGDGKVNKTDATLLFNYSMLPEKYASKVKTDVKVYGDVDSNGVIDIRDSQIIQSYASKKIKKLPHEHEMINGKCVCGELEQDIIYGDVNNDSEVDMDDVVYLTRYIEGLEDKINQKNTDVFLDNKIDYFDRDILLRNVMKASVIELPHICGSYKKEIGLASAKDLSVHKIEYLCKCGEIKFDTTEKHEMINGKCACGKQEPIYGDINGDGKVNVVDVAQLNAIVKGVLDKEINEEIADVDLDGKITEYDVNLIQKYVLGKIDKLPHEHEMINGECVCGEKDENEILYGDVNGDGKITAIDCALVSAAALGKYEIGEYKKAADVNLDGEITVEDGLLIQKYSLGKISELPHKCNFNMVEYEIVNEKQHKEITKCKCGEIKSEPTKVHEFVNGKCECGAEEKIIYGDINGDGNISLIDPTLLVRYVAGLEDEIDEKSADVFLDNSIDDCDITLLANYIGEMWKEPLPHRCGSYTKKISVTNDKKHEIEYLCKCGEMQLSRDEVHEFVNGKCECGAEEKIIYGDVNEDGEVHADDVTFLARYVEGLEDEIDEKRADVFLDGEIDNLDLLLVARYIAGIDMRELPHTCGSYKKEISLGNHRDSSYHDVAYLCKCGELSLETTEKHEFINGKCKCGVSY